MGRPGLEGDWKPFQSNFQTMISDWSTSENPLSILVASSCGKPKSTPLWQSRNQKLTFSALL